MKIADRYVQRTPLGIGGMGEIWEGADTRLNRTVAIKLIRQVPGADVQAGRRRFYREARILARLRHPGIPALYDFGPHGDDLFIVMELVEGAMGLRDLIAERGDDLLPVPWAAVIGAQLCAALAAAHQAGLIHRDLTPANVVLAPNGTVKILDFGVATAVDVSEFSAITQPGEVPGSLFYMAPELDGHTKADVRSDLYAVGCLLYELLTGRRVFQDPSPFKEIGRHQTESPVSPGRHRPGIPAPLQDLVVTLLAKNPAARPVNAAEVFAALLPYARDLRPLPGLTAPPDDPIRLYATAVAALPT
ncbi:serine/threonine-protein kinase [Thermomonospora cellulosilytica]|uniref:non-specific serine/threonine protein kinase n=1 Tax=Thermomonospora cellulosilytica TaxID=1411118 RepID=A0A7W3R7K0_9ACTN|nr:serine/threonine-protein kinase [Thermomonospora cellulosilytica]MBA9002716.1 serine/threonine protein kinase [Thermomonospora cellulosilytica]